MTEFGVTPLDVAELRAEQIRSKIGYGRRPEMRGYTNQGYAGGEYGGYNANWSPFARHPDVEFELSHLRVLARSYEQHRNNVMVYTPTNVLADSIGELIPTALTEDLEAAKILQDSWSEWTEQAGSDGDSDWSTICNQWVGSACQGGDVGVGLESRPELGGATPLRIKLHDAYRIVSPSDPQNGETVKLGVAKKQGAEVAYYVLKDGFDSLARDSFYRFDRDRNGRPNFRLFRRPEATRRPDQTRTPPIVSGILNEVKELGDYRRSTVRGAGKRSRHVQTLKSPDPDAVEKLYRKVQALRDTKQEHMIRAAAAIEESLKPTLVVTPDAATMNIPNYMSVENTPPDVTDTGYDQFLTSNLQLISGAWKLPYEVAYQIWRDASYSRAQILALQKGQTAQTWRKKMTPIANVIWRLHVQYTLAKNPKLKFREDLFKVSWHGPTQEYMDFETEVNAERDGRASGVLSPQSAARRTGRDAFQTARESLDFAVFFKDEMAARGLTNDDMVTALGTMKDKVAKPTPSEKTQ